jgi:hypothetical protein
VEMVFCLALALFLLHFKFESDFSKESVSSVMSRSSNLLGYFDYLSIQLFRQFILVIYHFILTVSNLEIAVIKL